MTTTVRVLSEHDKARLTALTELVAAREQHGKVPTATLHELAAALDMQPRSLSRLLAQYVETGSYAPCAPRKRQPLDENAAKNAYFFSAGDANAAYLLLKERNMCGSMGLRTFQRRIGTWPDWLRACAKGGYREMIKHQMFNTEHLPYRTYVYGMDHTLLPVQVILERGTKPVFVWLTVVMDLKTRVVLAWLLTPHTPLIEDSTAVLADAIDGWECERGFVGGKPEFLRTDRGSDFVSDAMNRGLLRIDVQRQFTEPYASWQYGRVERLHGTIDREFAPKQPGFFKGGEEDYNRRVFKVAQPVESLGTIERLDESFAEWFDTYNNRPHRSLDGRSPLEAWFGDPQPIQKADPSEIRTAMLRSDHRSLQRYGIEFKNEVYSSPSLGLSNCPIGTRVEVRYLQHKLTTVEVFADGTWICTATMSQAQSKEAKLGVVSRRAAQKREATERAATANYMRVIAERDAQRERGIPEEALPPLPPDPAAVADKAVGKRQPAKSVAASQANDRLLSRPGTTAEFDAMLTRVVTDIDVDEESA